jgi:hypothetical protein
MANLLPVSLTPVANLPLVSIILAKLVAKFAFGVVDTGGKFPPLSLILATILPLVSLIPVGASRLANISANFQKNLKRS